MKKTESNNAMTYFSILPKPVKQKTFLDRCTVAKEIFEFLCIEKKMETEPVCLYDSTGFALSSFPRDETPMTYCALDSKQFEKDCFVIAVGNGCERMWEIESLVQAFDKLMAIFDCNETVRKFIFRGLDTLPNSIHISDDDLCIIYANEACRRYMHLKNMDGVYGKPVEAVLDEIGVKFTAIKGNRDKLKARDVLRYGQPIVDWEVELSAEDSPDEYMRASNDMYPITDEDGRTIGVAEIARTRTTQIKQVQNVLGLSADYTFDDIIGSSRIMQDSKKLAMSFAASPYNVLIYGESGVGKELFAQSIHNYSPRRNKAFVAINCANISPELIDSELFGYERGAFTGASKNGQIGKFELADGGTLFLDEVAELPLHFQTKLLRALETKQITRVGGRKNISVDVRVIAATNRSLEKMIEEGMFREDLYYRLMVLNITIPPLRAHPEDILEYSNHFLKQALQINCLETKILDDSAKALLMQYDWPGNIRELRNVINRVCVLSDVPVITREIVLASLKSGRSQQEFILKNQTPQERLAEKRRIIEESNAALMKEALDISNGNRTEAAKLLNISRKTFYNMLEKYQAYFIDDADGNI